MRYFCSFIVCVLLSLPVAAEDSVLRKSELRVLDIGNSYTNGATSLLPLIAKASKADLSTMCLYKCTRGGASFKNWVDIYNDKDTQSTYSVSKVVVFTVNVWLISPVFVVLYLSVNVAF